VSVSPSSTVPRPRELTTRSTTSTRNAVPSTTTGRCATGETLWSVPNALTLTRLLIVPFIIGLSYSQDLWVLWLRNALFMAAAATDFLDGYLARHFGQLSRTGQLLDPLADKLLIVPCLVLLIAMGALPGPHLWPALLVIARELTVPTLRERYMEVCQKALPSHEIAKWKTALLMLSLTCLLMGTSAPEEAADATLITLYTWLYEVGILLLYTAAILGTTSLITYARRTFRAM